MSDCKFGDIVKPDITQATQRSDDDRLMFVANQSETSFWAVVLRMNGRTMPYERTHFLSSWARDLWFKTND